MSPDDLVRTYGKMLSSFERDEVLNHREPIYYINFNSNYKGHGKYNKTELNYLDENPEKNITANGILNNGFSNEQADYYYEAKDQIFYRYEVQKKLGRGAFGVVLKCFDHKTKEFCAVKVLKNWKKLHKQGKIEIKILETLRD